MPSSTDPARIHADHVLRGHEAVVTRLMQTIAPTVPTARLDRRIARRLVVDEDELPDEDPPPPEELQAATNEAIATVASPAVVTR